MPLKLNFDERRVLGVLMEKAFATPEQYPLTLNSLVTGSNQKSCRNPLSHLDEEAVLNTLDSLRDKNLVTLVRTMGSRTDRYKHRVSDTLQVEGKGAAVLAELLLRGPQTDGELRQRACRLVPIADLTELGNAIGGLGGREEPFIRRLSPEGQRRGVKYAHTLYPPGEEPTLEHNPAGSDAPRVSPESRPSSASASAANPAPAAVAEGVDSLALDELRQEVTQLKQRLDDLEDSVTRLLGGM